MPSYYQIPLSPQAQYFAITLGGVGYSLSFQFRGSDPTTADGFSNWIMDIYDANGFRLVCGIPLVTGANLLAPYGYLGFTGAIVVASPDGNPPTYANLGTDAQVYWVTLP